MNRSMQRRGWVIALGLACGIAAAGAGRHAAANPEGVVLNETGKRLEAEYAERLKTLRAEIAKAVPTLDAGKLAALAAARAEVAKAAAGVQAAQEPLGKIKGAEALVGHAKGKWIGGAEKGIAAAKAALEKATTDAEREAANAALAASQKDKEAGIQALADRQAALDAIKGDEPKHLAALEAAKAALAAAEAVELAAARTILADVDAVLSSDSLDAKLVPCAVIAAATPEGLAEFAQQGGTEEGLVRSLLADTALMREMLEAGGANGPADGHMRYSQSGGEIAGTLKSRGARYGDAMRIYTAITAASPRSKEGVLHQLALGTALELALPLAQGNAASKADGPAVVDPVQRYLHYEKAYLDGELDEAFPTMSAWECRLIVNSGAPNHALAWGREMLRNHRPDHVLTTDYGWRYTGLVRTDVAYRSSHLLKDDPALEWPQNICKEGGICGRRGFFSRYICQAFGVPAVCLRQPAHCALGRWTPQGWVTNLGGGWEVSSLGRPGLDFVLEAQAREQPRQYMKVLRAQWIGDALAEPKCDPWKPGSGGPWNQLALFEKKAVVADTKPAELAALGKEIGEANESAATKAKAVAEAVVTEDDRKIATGPDGTITIPAAACQGGNALVKSFLGGQQMIFGAGDLGCEVEVPAAGRYAVSARVTTLHDEQRIPLTAGGAKEPVEVVIPYTIGAWKKTPPVEVTLAAGKNVLTFGKPGRAFAVKDITLTPVK